VRWLKTWKFNRAAKAYALRLPPRLAQDYGGEGPYTVGQIDTAVRALALIEVDYELLPHVTDLEEAIADGAPTVGEGGNVFERATQLDLGNLRGAVGVGARYRSPIGPIRLDVGFKLDRRRLGTELERPWDFHFSIGHAF